MAALARECLGGAGSAGGAGGAALPLHVASWNVAAINNNPFEYWVTHSDAAYNEMMAAVQGFIDAPGAARDVAVSTVFTDAMWSEAQGLMLARGWDAAAVASADRMWREDLRSRKIISGFLKDGAIGDKRLASMPDRTTNTINLADGTQAFRPTPINCYPGTFASFADWWEQWKRFMFAQPLTVAGGKPGAVPKTVVPADLLVPIKRAKYPAVSEAEEAASLPLQVLCAAIFDAVQVHMLDSVAPGGKWQQLRHELSAALNSNKNARTLEILDAAYAHADVVFLQEVAHAFAGALRAHAALGARYRVIVPATKTPRDQLSALLVRRSLLQGEGGGGGGGGDDDKGDSVREVTHLVAANLEKEGAAAGQPVPVDEGDVLAAHVKLKGGRELLLASFHGDTNGLATLPVLRAVHAVAQSDALKHAQLIFGLDANTYRKGKPGKTQDVLEFGSAYVQLGMSSIFGDVPDPARFTTHNARTYLQPQLNKAAAKGEFATKGDVNPKDFILFYKAQTTLDKHEPTRDNTGRREYVEDMAFPTLSFPSDHAIIAATLLTSGL